MMLPTHALAGMALAVPLTFVAPDFAPIALVAGFLGGIWPDLDMYVGHRKTLHYPVYYSVLAAAALPIAALAATPAAVGIAFFLLGAAVHCASDVFGGGLELHPWEATSDRAVYDHFHGRWIAPRRLIGYDGSPADLALSAAIGVPLYATVGGSFRPIVAAALAVAVVYAVVRRVLPAIAERLIDGLVGTHLPAGVLTYLPARYVEGADEASAGIDG